MPNSPHSPDARRARNRAVVESVFWVLIFTALITIIVGLGAVWVYALTIL